MDKRATSIISYITLIGWLIAYCAGDKEGAKFHLNQSLVLHLASLIVSACTHIPLIGGIVCPVLNIIILVFWVIGLIYACENKEQEVPILGSIKILN